MRRQTRSTAAVAQPNLLHLWTTKSQCEENEPKKLAANESLDAVTIEGAHLGAGGVSLAGRTEATGAGLPESKLSRNTKSGRTRKQGISDSIPFADSGLAHEDEANLAEVSSGSENAAVLTETTNEDSRAPQPPKQNLSVTAGRKAKQHPLNGSSQVKLYPIFGNWTKHHVDVSAAETEPSNDKKEVRELRAQKAGRTVTKSDRSNFLKRTASEYVNTPVSVQDGIFVGPSSQPLSRSVDIIELTGGNEVAGPFFRSIAKGSQEEPIVIDSSPTRDLTEHSKDGTPSPRKPSRPVCGGTPSGFFAPRMVGSSETSTKPRKRVSEGELANWPRKDSQHVRGAQRFFTSPPCDFLQLRNEPPRDDPSASPMDSIRRLRCGETFYSSDEPRYLVEPVRSFQNDHAGHQDIRHSNASCPAISRFLNSNHDASNIWNDKWRPRCAAEVISNSESAFFLRDWLVALEINPEEPVTGEAVKIATGSRDKFSQSAKRPQVIRTVDKPRKRRKKVDWDEESLGDWLTSDEDESPTLALGDGEEAEEDLSDDHSDERGSPWRPRLIRLSRQRPPHVDCSDKETNELASAPTPTHDFSDRLTNAILLVGPTGSGKTATVYACAEELGWEVFEVYPGIGKRNGTSLVSLVGDVGKNHIVNRSSRGMSGTREKHVPGSGAPTEISLGSKQGKQQAASKAFASFFIQDHKDLSRDASCGASKSDYNVADSHRHEPPESPRSASVRAYLDSGIAHGRLLTPFENLDSRRIGAQQSIILLEEVDILFGEDVNFWPTVVALIRESRRPIIMTCNNSSLVPSDTLPLQTILSFDPCPSDLAITYLRCMALAEGYAASETHVKSLYGRNFHLDVLDIHSDLVRSSACPTSPPDLRQAIHSLQFLCQASQGFNNNSLSSSKVPDRNQCDDSALSDLSNWNWNQHPTSDSSFPFVSTEQAEIESESTRRIKNLWRISDALSMIDSYLARSSLRVLETHSYAAGCLSDLELGYPSLECETDILHLQDGITQYNHDEAIALEAFRCAGRTVGSSAAKVGPGTILDIRTEERWKTTTTELLLKRSGYFACVSGVLEKIVPLANRQSVDCLVLDYEAWVRLIDRIDMEMEAAALQESETRSRSRARGGRSTRNSQRMQYQRYFDLEDEARAVWHANALTESGEGES
ncbi:hypothetical protein A7U60_g1897 [Sanghuangporus baumii]|uniref:AAA+ ATPase domain-containing protein n=1 Tax=Sanghuangporus baumii TaxID=108892 RepID=A0A9Q5NAY8_SANBA|nr:hypothetical protein A7U60_g1897 [Sanghuangporus baumii]